jgi:hypothetical protein
MFHMFRNVNRVPTAKTAGAILATIFIGVTAIHAEEARVTVKNAGEVPVEVYVTWKGVDKVGRTYEIETATKSIGPNNTGEATIQYPQGSDKPTAREWKAYYAEGAQKGKLCTKGTMSDIGRVACKK